MKMIFFDTETTGLMPGSICQLSYILVDTDVKPNKTIGENFFFSVDYIEPSAEKVHGFSVDDLYKLSSGKSFEDSLENLLPDFLNADIFIGHNVNFDLKFMKHELFQCKKPFNPKHIFCTMNYYKGICKILNNHGNYKKPRLEEVVNFLGIDESYINRMSQKYFEEDGNFHDARFDTTATYLLVVEGIKQGYIPKRYFSKLVEKAE
ncbi:MULTISPECIES: 3'-5' exonuclease [Clostridium]|uniref:3'-5' exonuclease n=1 Tax=Clostridium TaxID=1485 RepID=UPI000825A030|nr:MULTISPECIES: 3'-5' exonuclease [Clostridium]PJI09015.1 3'-5' exonuclease [Clostridium sp. CT7]